MRTRPDKKCPGKYNRFVLSKRIKNLLSFLVILAADEDYRLLYICIYSIRSRNDSSSYGVAFTSPRLHAHWMHIARNASRGATFFYPLTLDARWEALLACIASALLQNATHVSLFRSLSLSPSLLPLRIFLLHTKRIGIRWDAALNDSVHGRFAWKWRHVFCTRLSRDHFPRSRGPRGGIWGRTNEHEAGRQCGSYRRLRPETFCHCFAARFFFLSILGAALTFAPYFSIASTLSVASLPPPVYPYSESWWLVTRRWADGPRHYSDSGSGLVSVAVFGIAGDDLSRLAIKAAFIDIRRIYIHIWENLKYTGDLF